MTSEELGDRLCEQCTYFRDGVCTFTDKKVSSLDTACDDFDEEMEPEKSTAYKCEECEEIVEAGSGEPLYECGECGTKFNRSSSHTGDSHQCPECQKFGHKIADDSCPECEAGELTEIEVVTCPHCQETVEADSYDEHKKECAR